ncbi:MAG: aminoacyl-tRNA hydrolase, partial [Pseudomonadota bacterium]|nr:aminoacyl-tRNA hydrolase [Pseudomonadota bacterium]
MFLLAGLGNKGKKYSDTRHNVGFNDIDKLVAHYEFKTEKKNLNSHTFRGIINDNKIILLKPMTFMNNSGKSVSEISSFYKIPLKRIFIIHDDVDLSVARVKVKCGGSDGGHNGIKSIDQYIAKDYYRIRIGIGKPANFIQVKDYVLK